MGIRPLGKNIKVSIIIPTFNCNKYISRCIRSCLEQSFSKDNFEIVVINDSSTDSTKSILESYGHWIRMIEHKEKEGISFSRNEGITNAEGEFIVNLDADDYLHRDFLTICYLYMKFNLYDAVATDYFIVDDQENILKRVSIDERPIACGIMFKKKQMINVGLYDTSLHVGEDVDFRIRFDKCYEVKSISLPLYRYRMHKNNITSDEIRNQKFLDIVAKKNNCEVNHSYHREEFEKYIK